MRSPRRDDGVFAILYAALIVAVFGMAAIVVDLGQLRADKRDGRTAADTAALAGASELGIGPYDPLTACKTAWAFTLENLRLPMTADPCAAMDADGPFVNPTTACPGTPNTAIGAVPGSGVTIAITWPVPMGSSFLTEPDGKPGPSPRPYKAGFDGSVLGCDRLAVSMKRERSFGLAAALGATKGISTAQSVARATLDKGDGDLFYPLIILDPISCDALSVTGGTRLVVESNGEAPGRIGIDSNGTATSTADNSTKCGQPRRRDGGDGGNGNGGAVIIDADSTNGLIEAQPGAVPTPTPTPTVAPVAAPAAIEIYGPDALPTNAFESDDLSCTGTAPNAPPCIKPAPTVSGKRITRRPFDKVYNCSASCEGGSAEKAYIDRFRTASLALTGTPAGWQVISGGGCKLPPPPFSFTGPPRYFIKCNPSYKVDAPRIFPPGSTVVIDGDLTVEGSGCLVINVDIAFNPDPCAPTQLLPVAPNYLTENGLLSVRGDILNTGAGSKLILPQTFLHQPLGTSSFNGTFERILWSAPFSANPGAGCLDTSSAPFPAAACFHNLAFWTETPAADNAPIPISGGGGLQLEGTFFLGNAKLKLTGGGMIDVTNSQFVAKRIEAFGGSLLTFKPNAERTTPVDRRGVTLVR